MEFVKSNSGGQIEGNSSKQKNNAAPIPRPIPQSGGQNQNDPNNQNPSNQIKMLNEKEDSNRPRQIPRLTKENWHYAHNIALSGNGLNSSKT